MHYLIRCLLLLCLAYSSVEAKSKRMVDISDNEILRKTIFLYTHGQKSTVAKAIAFVLRNRVRSNREDFGGKNIVDVCLQYWEHDMPERVELPEHEEVEMNKWLPRLWSGRMHDITKGALYFKFPDENGEWTEGMEKTYEINDIEFFKD